VTRAGVYAVSAVAAITFAASAFMLTRAGVSLVDALIAALPPAVLFGFFGFASRFACRALPLRSSTFSKLAAVHGGAAAMAGGVWLLAWQRSMPAGVRTDATVIIAGAVLIYGVMITMQYLLLEVEAAQRAEQNAVRYQLLAREAELKAYKAQIDPHFLFNSLNAVSALCGSNPAQAREMSQRLADFFRQTLRVAAFERITLDQEIELAARYLAIEKVRFGDRLSVDIRVDDAAGKREIPPLLLQPLVENAVRHGIAHTLEGGTVAIRAQVRQDALHVVVENPADTDRPESRGEGIGLANARGRLAAVSGGRARFEASENDGMFRVEIEVPA
jgi:two-component system sensor histidine kinase AlgZ